MNYLNIALPAQDGKTYTLNDFKNKYIILYFYPKDNTPGCTIEAIDFTAKKQDFSDENAVIIGVSKDSVKSHIRFHEKKNLDITLLSDEDLELINAFDVWREKLNYGKKYLGIVRSTFILNTDGKIIKEYRNIRVKNHVTNVLSDLKNIK